MNLVKIIASIIFVTTLSLSFQNCSPSQNTGLLGAKTSASSVASSINTNAPFGYDLAIDTISYNSCVGADLNSSGIHGIKMGANEGFVDNSGSGAVKAGLKLRSDFLTYVGKNVSPIYPYSVIQPSQIQYLLQNSTANKNAYIQYAIRHRTDLTVAVDRINPGLTAAVVPPRDGYVEPASLSTDPVLGGLTKNVLFGTGGTVLSEGPRIYNLYDPADSAARAIEASFGFSNYADETYPVATPAAGTTSYENFGFGEAYSDRVRQRFNSNGNDKIIAAVTYGDPTSGSSDQGLNAPMRSTETDKTKAYGRAYAFRFDQLSTKAGWRANLLRGVTESNLVDNTPASGASWTCENYVIMKVNEWNNSNPAQPACVPLNSTDMQSSTVMGQVKRLRRHYLESDWNIGLFYPKNSIYSPGARGAQPLCVVPKKAECYLPTNFLPTGEDIGVNYDSTTECYLYAYSVMGVSYSDNPTLDAARKKGRCAQYASICVRASTNY